MFGSIDANGGINLVFYENEAKGYQQFAKGNLLNINKNFVIPVEVYFDPDPRCTVKKSDDRYTFSLGIRWMDSLRKRGSVYSIHYTSSKEMNLFIKERAGLLTQLILLNYIEPRLEKLLEKSPGNFPRV